MYVDSGSTDNSVLLARSMNVEVIDLDLTVPFTAAQARNAGFARLTQRDDAIEFVQFVDGDCELAPDWLAEAAAAIEQSRDVAIVCGRLHERHPEQSIYNRICAIEWNGPLGEIAACGGIFMIRAAEFAKVGGFHPTIIAAEDDDLCLRIRANGGKVIRIDRPMAWHDAAMTRVSQWWRRAVRCGFAFAQISSLHGRGPFRHFVRETREHLDLGLLDSRGDRRTRRADAGLGALGVPRALPVCRLSHRRQPALARPVAGYALGLRHALSGLEVSPGCRTS